MGITNSGQLSGLFLSCGLGFLLGAYYDVFRVARLIMRPSKRAVFFQDLFFFLSSAVATFFFALTVTGGALRFYLFLGILIGFAAYYVTVGRLVVACAGAVVRAVLAAWHWFWHLAFAPFRLLRRLLTRPFGAFGCLCGAAGKKVRLFLKKGLKQPGHLLYNRKKKADTEDVEEVGSGPRGPKGGAV